MRAVRDTRLLFGRSAVALLRNPAWLFVGATTPILYLALFTPLLKHLTGHAGLPGANVLDGFLPGILAFLAFASGSGPGFNTIFELKAGVIERLRVTPASRLAILLGPILANLAFMLAFDLVLVAVGAAFGFGIHPLGLLVLGVLIALLMSAMAAFSIASALLLKDISSFAAIINGLNLPVLLLAGVLLPISLGPLWLRILAHFDPLYYLVAAARALGTGHFTGPHVWQAFAVLVPLALLILAWATRVVRHAVS
jgi:ABC-2 type transport system permease protein